MTANPPREFAMSDRRPIATPATLWLEGVVAMFEWHNALVRFAFGSVPGNGHGEALETIAVPESKAEEPPSDPPPDSLSRPLVAQLRPKQRKTSARGKHRNRSKMSGSTRRRRAA